MQGAGFLKVLAVNKLQQPVQLTLVFRRERPHISFVEQLLPPFLLRLREAVVSGST